MAVGLETDGGFIFEPMKKYFSVAVRPQIAITEQRNHIINCSSYGVEKNFLQTNETIFL